MTTEWKLSTGVIVKLKSGGPEMTVNRFVNEKETIVVCQWFAGKKLEVGNFPVDSLDVVKQASEPK